MNSSKKKNPRPYTPTDSILESISDGVFTIDMDWRIKSFNRAAEQITGVRRQDAIDRLCSDVFRSNMCETDCPLRLTLETGKAVIGKSCYIVNADGDRIPISVSSAVLKDEKGHVIGGAETFRDLSEVEALRRELQGKFSVGDFVSRSPIMQKVIEALPAVAASPSTVLILGETGTGKEVLARTIHSLSPRRKGPFIAVNCSALPDTLLESELFGYKAGAFTGAMKDKPGRFDLAKDGTLFLDEIAEINPVIQVKLLRVLQDRTYEPLGGTKTRVANSRIIAATNKDLAERMRQGLFREDLYYRINIVRIELPPLRKRKEDIPLLAQGFVERFNRLQGRSIAGVSPEALSLLMAYEWPGNIRELENVIERSFIMCSEGVIGINHLPDELTARHLADEPEELKSAHDLLDAQAIQTALERNGYNRVAAAKELHIHKTTLFRRIKKLGITLPKKHRHP